MAILGKGNKPANKAPPPSGLASLCGRSALGEIDRAQPDGKPVGAKTIIRVDPSLPYANQFFPIEINGENPSLKQLKEWGEFGEDVAKRRHEQSLVGAAPVNDLGNYYLRLYGENVTPVIEEAVVLDENVTSISYEVPLKKV